LVQILGGELVTEEITSKAMGGTELIAHEMVRRLPRELLRDFQIVHSRMRNLDRSKKRVFVAHDLPGDPELEFLHQGGYNQFDRLVFVSHWQMQRYIEHYGIPWYKCAVVQNAINPISPTWVDGEWEPIRDEQPVNIIYHTTPHRGLNILANAFSNLPKDLNVHLDVYSSFEIYGWKERDAQYQDLFAYLREGDPRITYHGFKPNSEVREALGRSHIFAYPSVWPETSCIALIEAMSAGLICVHPNYAALPETAANWTWMYQKQDSERDHTRIFYANLVDAISSIRHGGWQNRLSNQKQYTDLFYNWDLRALQWEQLLRSI
jgi:UDP-glucose:(glucosyl)LPS alpha-1,2-glucosyltransferase